MKRRMFKVLDLYCCEGGISRGYDRAGWDVYGSDLFRHKTGKFNKQGKEIVAGYSQKRYPYPSLKGDALIVLDRLLAGEALPFTHKDGFVEWLRLEDFDLILASPPCQHASAGTRALRQQGKEYPALIPPTRKRLIATGLPYVIENVEGADLVDPIELCGCMFDMKATDTDGITLYLQRPRRFEAGGGVQISAPRPHDHSKHEWVGGSYGGARRDKYEAKFVRKGGYVPSIPVQQELLGIDWMTQAGMFQCVPPRYAEHLGRQILQHLYEKAA